MKKLLIIFLIFSFLNVTLSPLYAYSSIGVYLCEIGIQFYQDGRYAEALHEFNKSLMVNPGYPLALEYIEKIKGSKAASISPKKVILPPLSLPKVEKKHVTAQVVSPGTIYPPKTLTSVIPKAPAVKLPAPKLPKVELPKRELPELKLPTVELPKRELPAPKLPKTEAPKKELPEPKKALVEEAIPGKIYPPKTLVLDESLKNVLQPIEIEQGKSIVILGRNIQRFLVTEPGVINVERKSGDELLATGKDIGYSYLHIWDDSGRTTLEFLTVPLRPAGPTLEEQMRRQEERAHAFKVRYNVGWNSFETGRRFTSESLNRRYFSWYHQIALNGGTPYGEFDSSVVIRTLNKSTDLTYFTFGLDEGAWGDFKGFSLRGFDFLPGFINIALGTTENLRGVMFKSPAFDQKIDYTVFWGREGGGRYGNLSPGLGKIKHSFLEGFDINHYLFNNANYGFSVFHGHGRDRAAGLNRYAYDGRVNWQMDKWKLGYEVASDTQEFAQVLNSNYTQPKVSLITQLRNISDEFVNISNVQSWRTGERGALMILNYAPTDKFYLYNNLDVFQDRTVDGVGDDFNWNQDYDFNARYTLDQATSLRAYYTLQNEIGRLTKTRYQSPGVGLTRNFNLIRPISTYVDYRHRENKNFSGPSADYINDAVIAGLRFSVISDLYYFANKQYNWLEERFTGLHSNPQVFETGLDFNRQIYDTPFYGNFRLTYRDEEDTGSILSFLSGEDYLEGYSELSYRPNKDQQIYCSTRLRNVWADNPAVNKRVEADFNAGMRYVWDTGVHWESVGQIEGYIFKDINSDGLRQRDEAPVEGIVVWLGKSRSVKSDIFGFYKFDKVKGKKAFVTLDVKTLPAGFVLTVPLTQEAQISQGKSVRADFGMVSRSEISGMVFYDVNADGKYNADDIGVKDVVLTLENGIKASTDSYGRYSFRNAKPGEHTVTLDLKSLDVAYLPMVPVVGNIALSEGVAYIYNIPLRKVK